MIEKIESKSERFAEFCEKKMIMYPSIVKYFEVEGDEIKKVVFWGESPEGFNGA